MRVPEEGDKVQLNEKGQFAWGKPNAPIFGVIDRVCIRGQALPEYLAIPNDGHYMFNIWVKNSGCEVMCSDEEFVKYYEYVSS